VNSTNVNLLKAIILGGFYPRVAKVHLPNSAIKFDKIQAGTVQRENTAKEYRLYDTSVTGGQRVFLHPSSVLFKEVAWKSGFVAYFKKQETNKIFVRDVSEVEYLFPQYAQA
jgi:ATP-dependent RNA helicase DHX57